jgi:hypothetical protein
MQIHRPRKPETLFTREMRQITSFLDCYKEKKLLLNESPHLGNTKQIFMESDFNFIKETSTHPQHNELEESQRGSRIKSTTNVGNSNHYGTREKRKGANAEAQNVHHMNRDPKSIFNLLRNSNSQQGQNGHAQSLEYSETERGPSQRVSNLWRESQNSRKRDFPDLNMMFENNHGHLGPGKKGDFLERMQKLGKEESQGKGHPYQNSNSKNVFVNTDQFQRQKNNFMEELFQNPGGHSAKGVQINEDRVREIRPMEIKQAESFYEVESSQR